MSNLPLMLGNLFWKARRAERLAFVKGEVTVHFGQSIFPPRQPDWLRVQKGTPKAQNALEGNGIGI